VTTVSLIVDANVDSTVIVNGLELLDPASIVTELNAEVELPSVVIANTEVVVFASEIVKTASEVLPAVIVAGVKVIFPVPSGMSPPPPCSSAPRIMKSSKDA
jgi:hypothetical protein